jgi:hypothetical protein
MLEQTRNSILVILPYANSDADLMLANLSWMQELGGCKTHPCLIVCAHHVNNDLRRTVRQAAQRVFESTEETSPIKTYPDESWPKGANILFDVASKWVEKNTRKSFLWCESDAVPISAPWLERWQQEYIQCCKPFMGVILKNTTVFGKSWPAHLVGVATYPFDTASRFASLDLEHAKEAWDIISGALVNQEAHHTRLLFHVWGEKNLPPTFAEARTKGCARNVLTFDQIPKDCVLWHRCKDNSLRKLLRSRIT